MHNLNGEQVLSINYLLKYSNHNVQYYIVKSIFE